MKNLAKSLPKKKIAKNTPRLTMNMSTNGKSRKKSLQYIKRKWRTAALGKCLAGNPLSVKF